ncbi:MAG: insulinase family protein [Myxococcota bacterium]|nr:insulinase family protein [Myxococcota bacterium]
MRRLLCCAALFPALALAVEVPQPHTLPNGLQVLVIEDHAQPLVTVEIAVKNGSYTESPEYNGLSHLYEHMFFKANAALPTQEAYMARLRELGISFNGTTSTERVNYFFTSTSDNFEGVMVFMRDALLTLRFDPGELERERVVVTGEMDRAEANPFYEFYRAIDRKVWWKHFSRKQPLGDRQTVLSATVAQMRTIKERYYVPNNSLLVVSGDVKPQEVYALAGKLYADWKRAPDPFVKYPVPKHPPIQRTAAVVMEKPAVKTVNLGFTWHGPSTVGPGKELTYAADVLGYAVSEPSSRFQKALVDSGKCVRAGFSWQTQAQVGPINFSAEALPEKADECVQAMQEELVRMKAPDYLSPQEMANAVFREEVSQIQSREKPSDYAHTVTFWWTAAGLDYYASYVENMRKVTPSDIGRYLSTYVENQPYVFGAIVSPEATKLGLDQAHFEELLGIGKKPVKVKGGKR